MHLQTLTRPHDFINVSSDFILKICRSDKKSRINIALSGGSTPQKIYESLAKKLSFMPLENQLHFYQVDERYIKATHKDSNQKMIMDSFSIANKKFSPQTSSSSINDSHSSKNQPRPCIHFHFFDTSLPIKEALKKYSKELPKAPFDLMVLGIGHDGHTASLFPNSKALTTRSPLAHTTTEEFAVKSRLTLTFNSIMKSKKILILLKGKEKLQTLNTLKRFAKNPKKISTSQIINFPALKLLKNPDLTVYSCV